jgi:hypothetical protein
MLCFELGMEVVGGEIGMISWEEVGVSGPGIFLDFLTSCREQLESVSRLIRSSQTKARTLDLLESSRVAQMPNISMQCIKLYTKFSNITTTHVLFKCPSYIRLIATQNPNSPPAGKSTSLVILFSALLDPTPNPGPARIPPICLSQYLRSPTS